MTQARTNTNGKLSRQELDMNKWWTSLSITNKETLSGKPYPTCTVWWNDISLEQRVKVHYMSGIVRAPRNKSKGFT